MLSRRSILVGALGAVAMAVFYVVVVWGASRSAGHVREQIGRDWVFLVLIVAGFGTQVALFTELRRLRTTHPLVAAAGGTGAGASAAGMVACCAHHIGDLVPFVAASGAAAFLTAWRVPFMLAGIGLNATGIAISARRLHRVRGGEGGA